MNIIFSSAIYVAPAAAVRKRPVQSGSHESEQKATPLPIGALLDSPKKIFFSKIPILIRALILQGFSHWEKPCKIKALCEGLIRWGGGFF